MTNRRNNRVRDYINHLSDLIYELGIRNDSQRISRDGKRLTASLYAKSGKRIEIFFTIEGTDLYHEVVFDKTVSGDPESVSIFYKSLLALNSSLPNVNFGMVEERRHWTITLQGNTDLNSVNDRMLTKIIDSYDLAITEFIPRLEIIADQLKIEFDGREQNIFKELVKTLFG